MNDRGIQLAAKIVADAKVSGNPIGPDEDLRAHYGPLKVLGNYLGEGTPYASGSGSCAKALVEVKKVVALERIAAALEKIAEK
ncbi:MAG: hypothetical protein SOT69_04210 [Mesosutterella sp.]|nr:hypothetical protein [Mesosutterella sp.]